MNRVKDIIKSNSYCIVDEELKREIKKNGSLVTEICSEYYLYSDINIYYIIFNIALEIPIYKGLLLKKSLLSTDSLKRNLFYCITNPFTLELKCIYYCFHVIYL